MIHCFLVRLVNICEKIVFHLAFEMFCIRERIVFDHVGGLAGETQEQVIGSRATQVFVLLFQKLKKKNTPILPIYIISKICEYLSGLVGALT